MSTIGTLLFLTAAFQAPSALVIRHGEATVTVSIMLTQRKPKLVTRCFLLDRAASRYTPFSSIFSPCRRSRVSSAATMIGIPMALNAATSKPNRI